MQLVHIYLNFVGYMHICIGIGRLAGYTLPENFDKPYLSKNFLDLWARWHITLSEWFKFYLFNPLLKSLNKRWGGTKGRSDQYFGAIAFFMTFLTMGIWHGSTAIFVVYGLLLGGGVTANKIWQIRMSRHLGKVRYREICQRAWYGQLSRALTLSYFAVALTCVWIDPVQVSNMASMRGMLCGLITLTTLTILLLVVLWLTDLVRLLFRQRDTSFLRGDIFTAMLSGLKLFLTINFAVALHSGAPEFVYKYF